MKTASGRLRLKIELVNGPFAGACTTLFRHPRLAELWPEYAIRTYWIIRATVPLMEEAEALARARARDPVAAGVAEFLTAHIEKERGHDDWVLEDLELLGQTSVLMAAQLGDCVGIVNFIAALEPQLRRNLRNYRLDGLVLACPAKDEPITLAQAPVLIHCSAACVRPSAGSPIGAPSVSSAAHAKVMPDASPS